MKLKNRDGSRFEVLIFSMSKNSDAPLVRVVAVFFFEMKGAANYLIATSQAAIPRIIISIAKVPITRAVTRPAISM